jgi:hypothetical protein
MPKIKSIKKTFLLGGDEFKKLIKRQKTALRAASEIASTVNWHIKYAYYKPEPPREEELKIFKKVLEEIKREYELYKMLLKGQADEKLSAIEAKLKTIEEEFITYPFSDRLKFFLKRLEFIKYQLRNLA